jgi:hypothetical protein
MTVELVDRQKIRMGSAADRPMAARGGGGAIGAIAYWAEDRYTNEEQGRSRDLRRQLANAKVRGFSCSAVQPCSPNPEHSGQPTAHSTFLGPKWLSLNGSMPFHRAQKSLDFQGPTSSHLPS